MNQIVNYPSPYSLPFQNTKDSIPLSPKSLTDLEVDTQETHCKSSKLLREELKEEKSEGD